MRRRMAVNDVAASAVNSTRARLNAKEPRAVVNVPLRGSELSIEFTQGANGPLQDRVVLTRAMLLVE